MGGGFKLDRINSEEIIFLTDINNRYRNMLNPYCEVVYFYNVNCGLTVLVDGS